MNQFALSVSPLAVMMFVASITPGPNNLMLMLAGTRFGFTQTLPHLAGITTGTVIVICLACVGLGALMLAHPTVVDWLTVASGMYLLWMASRLLRPAARGGGNAPAARLRPMRFSEAVGFQFVNPKVWTMAVAAASIAAHFPYPPVVSMVVVAATTAVVNSPCIALWAACGKALRHRLDDPRLGRWFNACMAALVLGTAVWLVWPVFKL